MAVIESERIMSAGQAAFLFGFALLSMAVPLVAIGKAYLGIGDMITWGIALLMLSRILIRLENRKA